MFLYSASTPIVKPVDGRCNLSCQYCYASGIRKTVPKNCMRLETLKAVIDFFCHSQNSVEFIWHGGEPLFAGLSFYRKVVEFQSAWKQKGRRITNFVQTNATLVTPEWTRFFADHNFLVGVSIDGPKEIHDQVRYYSAGKGSHDEVMRGIDLLRQDGVFNGIICVISAIDYKFPKEIFNFFLSSGIKKLKFPKIKSIGCCDDISALAISSRQYIDFVIAIFDLWLEIDDPEVEIRDIQTVVNVLLGGSRRECYIWGGAINLLLFIAMGQFTVATLFRR